MIDLEDMPEGLQEKLDDIRARVRSMLGLVMEAEHQGIDVLTLTMDSMVQLGREARERYDNDPKVAAHVRVIGERIDVMYVEFYHTILAGMAAANRMENPIAPDGEKDEMVH